MLADGQISDSHRTDGRAHQLEHLAPDGVNHAPHLAIPALRQGDLEEGVLRTVAQPLDDSRTGGAVTEGHTAPEEIQLVIVQESGRFHLIRLGDFMYRVCKPFGELRVVGKNQQPARVQVQPAHGKHPLAYGGHEIIDSGTAFGIFVGREIAFGLIEEQIEFLACVNGLVVKSDAVAREIHPVIWRLDLSAVDANSPGSNPVPGFGART